MLGGYSATELEDLMAIQRKYEYKPASPRSKEYEIQGIQHFIDMLEKFKTCEAKDYNVEDLNNFIIVHVEEVAKIVREVEVAIADVDWDEV